jgi:hypothetical protein
VNSKKHSRILWAIICLAIVTFSLAVSAQAQTESAIFDFTGYTTTGAEPNSGLISDSAGNFYGVTFLGGKQSRYCKTSEGCGFVYELSPGSGGYTQTILYNFTGSTDGGYPVGNLVFDGAGNLYGATGAGGDTTRDCFSALGCGVVYELSPKSGGGWTETVLYTFTNKSDGATPIGAVTLDAAGNVYGAAAYGGNTACESLPDGFACGVAFELTPSTGGSWTETILHSFTGGNDGYNPNGGLVFDSEGNLYGAAVGGNPSLCGPGGNCGLVYKLSSGASGWTETVLHNFSGGRDGGTPNGYLVFDSSGSLYGTSTTGGDPACGLGGTTNDCGVVFKLTKNARGAWTETDFEFERWDGAQPYSGVTLDGEGNIYGAASLGGILTCYSPGFGCGVIYKLTPSSSGGWTPSVLHRFTDGSDGAIPNFAPIFDASGNMFGTTGSGGTDNYGTVWEIQR